MHDKGVFLMVIRRKLVAPDPLALPRTILRLKSGTHSVSKDATALWLVAVVPCLQGTFLLCGNIISGLSRQTTRRVKAIRLCFIAAKECHGRFNDISV